MARATARCRTSPKTDGETAPADGERPGATLDVANTVWPLPPEWAGAAGVAAVALTEAGEGERHELAVKDGTVSFDLPTDVPFRVTRLA